MSDDLKNLFPGHEITVGGETIAVLPFTFGQLPRATKLMLPVAKALQSANVIGINQDGGELSFSIAADWPTRLIEILAEGGEDLLSFLAFAVGKPREWFDAMGIDEGIVLAKAVLEVNADFFVKKVLPMLGLSATPTAGATSSPDSSQQATDAPTSTDTP